MCHSKYALDNIRNNPDFDLISKLQDDDLCNVTDICMYAEPDSPPHWCKNNFSIMHLNIRSLVKNLCNLKFILETFTPDVVMICETFLHENNVNKCHISNYDFYHCERKSGKGGGIAIYTKRDLSCTEVNVSIDHDDFVEELSVSCMFKNKKYIFTELYRKPNTNESTYLKYLSQLADKLYSITPFFVIGCDQNIDLLKTNNTNVEKLIDVMYEGELVPTILKPTRITKSSATLIDQIYVSTELFKKAKSLILIDDTSDHYPCILGLNVCSKVKKQVQFKGRNLCDQNVNALIDYLNCFKWENLNMMSLNDCYNTFISVLDNGMNIFMPERDVCIKRDKIIHEEWLTKGIIRCNKKCRKLYLEWMKGACPNVEIKYKEYRNNLNKIKRRAKFMYYDQFFHENFNNMKKSWKVLNNILGKFSDKSVFPSFIQSGDIRIDSKTDMANAFNVYFGKIGRTYSERIPPSSKLIKDYLPRPLEPDFNFRTVTPSEIISMLNKLKNKSSSGHDGLTNNFIKRIKNGICTPLSVIVNKSLMTGSFPNALKIAEVCPLYKAGFRNVLTNYRPISLLPVFSKIVEKIVHQQLYDFLETNNVLHKNQFGFRPGHSCNDCILKLVNDLMPTKTGQFGASVMLDLSKAFDSLTHSTILQKLECYGVRNVCLSWFKDYFTNRTQRVKLQEIKSNYYELNFGIGQGTILGPLVFIIVINDLYSSLKYCTVLGFADDTTIYVVYHNLMTMYARLKHDLRIAIEWFKTNKLTLNADKSVFMAFSNRKIRGLDAIKVANNNILRVTHCKLLGCIIDDKLKWHHHLDYLCKKLKSSMFALSSTRNLLPAFIKLRIYYSFVYSHINYCCESWGSMLTDCQIKRLQILQNKCIRHILRLKKTASVTYKFRVLRLLDIKNIFKASRLKLMYRKDNDLLPAGLNNLYSTANHDYNTRYKGQQYSSYNPILEKCKNDWNQLDPDIRRFATLETFKYHVKAKLYQ